MGRGRRPATAAVAAFGLLAFGATPALAAKSGDKDSKPGKLKTATASATAATSSIVTVTATCPGKSKVVGGGFVLQPPTGGDGFNVIESRRASNKAWRVSAHHGDAGAAGPAMTATAEAYCRTGLGKLTEKAVGETILGGSAGAAPVATCPPGRAALSGGFSITPPANPASPAIHELVTANLMTGGVGWTMRALNLVSPPLTTTFTSYVYCQQKGEKAPKVVTGTGTVAPPPPLVIGAADTAPCKGKRDAFAGGFELPNLFGAGVLFMTESRHSGKGWHIAAARVSGANPISITAHGYCS